MVAGVPAPDGMRVLSQESQLRVAEAVSSYAERLRYARDLTYGGARSLDAAFGYKDVLTVDDLRARYERGGVAARIVDTAPNGTWRGGLELIEDPDPETTTAFEAAWNEFATRTRVTTKMHRADRQSQLAAFSVIIIGDGNDPKMPLAPGDGTARGILHLVSYSGSARPTGPANDMTRGRLTGNLGLGDVGVATYDLNPKSARYGQPETYNLRRNANLQWAASSVDGTTPGAAEVHWSRVIHIAERTLDDDLFGYTLLERVWNDLDNLKKVVGGGAEAAYQNGKNPRLWSIDKDIAALSEPEAAAFREQIEKLQHEEVADVRMRGVTATTLAAAVPSFESNAAAIEKLIAGACEMPQRLLFGSEQGEMASTQDRDNYRDIINSRRKNHAWPVIVQALVDRLIEYKHLPQPKQYEPRWGAVLDLTIDERIAGSSAWANAKTEQGQLFSNDENRDRWWEMAPLDDEQLEKMREAAEQRQADAIAVAQAKRPEPAFRAAAEDETVRLLEAAIADGDLETLAEIVGIRQ